MEPDGWVEKSGMQDGSGTYRVDGVVYKIVTHDLVTTKNRVAFLKGKEVARAGKFTTLIKKLKKLEVKPESKYRYVKSLLGEPLFMGAGDHSLARSYELVSDLIDAIHKLNSIQQFGLFGTTVSEENEDLIEKDKRQIEITAAKIFYALTGDYPQ